MKSKEEIEQLAEQKYFHVDGFEEEISEGKRHFIVGYTQCQEDMFQSSLVNTLKRLYTDKKYTIEDFFNMIEEYREKELPNRNVPYHYEAEIDSGLKYLITFIKEKQLKDNK
jgi:hypothetical protein